MTSDVGALTSELQMSALRGRCIGHSRGPGRTTDLGDLTSRDFDFQVRSCAIAAVRQEAPEQRGFEA
eukprot:8712257-Alexandrium_andersonii.AAC.1